MFVTLGTEMLGPFIKFSYWFCKDMYGDQSGEFVGGYWA